jgi:hypothetical protein
MGAQLEAGAEAALLDYRTQAPDAARNHPTDEHLLPLYVALGAAGEGAQAKRIHADTTWSALAMDAYLFGRELDPLAARIGLPALVHTVARRQAYQHALLLGWKALDGGAREEILQVALEIVTL